LFEKIKENELVQVNMIPWISAWINNEESSICDK
jgi:hypothetical protein